MKLCDFVKQDIEGYKWNEFEEHWYCKNCRKAFHIMAKGRRDTKYCSECCEEMEELTDEMIRISEETTKQGTLKFTDEERKDIFDSWRKSIKKIPTWEAVMKRQERAKKPHQTSVSV
jgi:hypothetical protein